MKMVFGEGESANREKLVPRSGDDFYRKSFGGAGGGGALFLFYNAVLYCFAWREYDCARVMSDYGLTQHGV
jgi:hypothetical protein